jgi:phosphohistidine phosphatase
MQVLLIRHGIAEDTLPFASTGGNDTQRPLTEMGRKKLLKAANRLCSQIENIDLLASSTLLRARQTAEIIARAFGDIAIEEREDLSPHSIPDSIVSWLGEFPSTHTVVLVGHEPHLNLVAGVLLIGKPQPLLLLKKGGGALLDFEGRVAPGTGKLRWLLTPRQLRCLTD